MKAVVLVGGEGTRLRPLTSTDPKQMLSVAGVPMIERVLAQLAAYDIDDVVLSLGYRPDSFMSAYPEGRAGGVRLTYAVEPEPRDTAGAIRFAAMEAGITDTFLVVNGDVLTDLDIAELVAFHRDHDASATISLTPVDDPSAFGVVPTDSDGKVEAFIEKPPRDEAPTNLINAGTYVLEPGVIDLIAPDVRVSVEKVTFPRLVEAGSLYALASKEYWLDTGTPALYIRAALDILAGRRRFSAPMPGVGDQAGRYVWTAPSASVEGEVEGPALLEDGARVSVGARVSASHLGAGVVIGQDAVVRGSVVLAGAVVEDGATVEDSVIGPDAHVGHGARVLAVSVVGHGATVEAGTSLSGARYPGS